MTTIKQNILSRIAVVSLIAGMIFTSVPAPAYAILYSPGETLNPGCAPTDTNCDVITSTLKGRLSEALTGTVSVAPGSSLVTGSSTAFTTELSVGDAIKIGSEVFSIGSIASNLSLILSSAVSTSTATTTGATAYRDPTTLFSVTTGVNSNVLTVSKAGLLALINALTISSSIPTTTANALYNQGGTLYWNGVAISSASSTVVTTATSTGITTSRGLLFADANGNLVADEGISYNPSTNKLTLTGGLDPLWLQAKDISGGNAAYYEWYAGQSAATSTASTGRIIYDSTDNRLKVSQNGSAYTALQTVLSGTLGQLLSFNTGGNPTAVATSTLGIALSDTTGTLAANRGGTGLATITQNSLLIGGAGNTWTQVATSSLGLLTTNVAEGTNQYYTDTRARNALSANILGMTYSTSTGQFSLTSGYNIPLTASTTNWNNSFNTVNSSSTNWNTAYGWGNHATAGYVSSSTAFTNNGNSFGGLATLGTTDNNALRFVASSTEAMRILANGNIGIGTSTPSSKLAIVGGGFNVYSQIQTGTQTNPNLNSGNGTILGTAIGGTDTVIRYTTTGTTAFTPPTGVTNVRVLAVAGGGGGGNNGGGGGGAGGYIASSTVSVTPGNSVSITVGPGGAGSTDGSTRGVQGSSSSFGSITTAGGGGGGVQNQAAGGNGGSGGGGSMNTGGTGGTGTPAGQGNNGGAGQGSWACPSAGGGGGGAGATGGAAVSGTAGAGGAGLSNDITGSSVFYAGGGGGGRPSCSTVGSDGAGGGGVGGAGNKDANGGNATANTGGGGGAGNAAGGTGGSGIVIVRFATVAGVATSSQALFKVTNAGTDTNSVLAFFETGASQSCIIAGGSGLSCSSDENIKKDIQATEAVLGNVLALKPVTYNWRAAEELGVDGFDPYAVAEGVTGDSVGFIAQDVEKIFPSLVRLDPNGNRTLAYDKFAPIIVAALQEQYGGMMGVNIASVGNLNELFATEESLSDDNSQFSILNFQSISNGENDQTKGVAGYLKEKVASGIKIVRELVAERIVAVSGYFKRIFANELCLTDSNGQLVCVTGDALKNLNEATVIDTSKATTSEPAKEPEEAENENVMQNETTGSEAGDGASAASADEPTEPIGVQESAPAEGESDTSVVEPTSVEEVVKETTEETLVEEAVEEAVEEVPMGQPAIEQETTPVIEQEPTTTKESAETDPAWQVGAVAEEEAVVESVPQEQLVAPVSSEVVGSEVDLNPAE